MSPLRIPLKVRAAMEEALNIWVDCAMIIMSGFVGAAGLMALMEDRSDVFAVYWALVAATGFIFVGIWTTKALRDGGDE